ncbi:family 20 glycosylhydrolase [Microbacterium sp. NPDC089189]|uniref:family 20 glycosylhydrolase n=1 Tax=Microbacterium sp. NPDC089189 TaxID=3154972 RepID=UPI00344954FE
MRHGLVPVPRSQRDDDDSGGLLLRAPIRLTGPVDAVALLREGIARRTGLPLDQTPVDTAPEVSLRVDRGGAPESYRLHVSPAGADVVGADAAGLFYGTRSLLQLLTETPAGWMWPAVDIDDAPRFAHRGLMLDVARHFFPVDVVERLIERAAALKLNVLHLHLSDDQGWRLALDRRPDLSARASQTAALGDAGGFYTRAAWDRLLACAAAHHMTVIPEIDVPGHTHAVTLAYPEVTRAPVITPEVAETIAAFGGGTPVTGEPYTGFAVGFSSLRIGETTTSDFLADVFGELASLTPGPWLHVGGDEALGTSSADYAVFIAEVTRLVRGLGKTPIAWHEAGGVADIAPGTIGQYWGFVSPRDGMDEKARGFVRAGGRLILSPADAIYLDMKYDARTPLGLTWADGPTPLERAYDWEPTAIIDGIEESDILGVEAAVWTETIRTEQDLEAMVFPRLAAAAEIAWSPAAALDWPGFRERLAVLAAGWDAAGVAYTRADGVAWITP